jgi:hypothetical protein
MSGASGLEESGKGSSSVVSLVQQLKAGKMSKEELFDHLSRSVVHLWESFDSIFLGPNRKSGNQLWPKWRHDQFISQHIWHMTNMRVKIAHFIANLFTLNFVVRDVCRILTLSVVCLASRIQKEKKNEKKRTSLGGSERADPPAHNQVTMFAIFC